MNQVVCLSVSWAGIHPNLPKTIFKILHMPCLFVCLENISTLTNDKLQSVNIDSVSIEIIHEVSDIRLDSFWKQNIQKLYQKVYFYLAP